MADKLAPEALEVIKTPDYEAMVIGAHPDDDDVGAAGVSALWAKQGKKIVWVVMTDGAEGSEIPSLLDTDLMLAREREQRAACEVLGVQAVEFLRQELAVDREPAVPGVVVERVLHVVQREQPL